MAAKVVCLNKTFGSFEVTKALYIKRNPKDILRPVVEKDITLNVKRYYKGIVPIKNLKIQSPDLSPLEGPKIVVSDAHFGDKSRADDFYSPLKEEKYLQLIDEAKKLGATWIDLGDRFELWQAKLSDIIRSNTDILSALAGLPRVIYVLGNHDRSLAPFLLNKRLGNTTVVEYLYDPESNSFFTHGNIERENSHASNLGYFATRMVGQFERRISSRFDEVAEKWRNMITPTSRWIRENEPYFINWVSILSERIKKEGYGSKKTFKLLFGHTHEPSAPNKSSRGRILQAKSGSHYQYWNTGCWVGDHTDYIFIDEKGRVYLRKA